MAVCGVRRIGRLRTTSEGRSERDSILSLYHEYPGSGLSDTPNIHAELTIKAVRANVAIAAEQATATFGPSDLVIENEF